MRRGEMVRTLATAETSPAELAELMVGRRVLLRVEKTPANPGAIVLEVENLRLTDDKGVARLKAVSFAVAGRRDPRHRRRRRQRPVGAPRGAGRHPPGDRRRGAARRQAARPQPLDQRRRPPRRAASPTCRRTGTAAAWSCPSPQWENSCLGYQARGALRGPGLHARPRRDPRPRPRRHRALRHPPADAATSRPPTSPAATSRRSSSPARSSATPRCCSSASRPAASTSAPSSSSTSRSSRCATAARRSCSSRSSSTRSRRSSDRIVVMFDGRISGERAGRRDRRARARPADGRHRPGHARAA